MFDFDYLGALDTPPLKRRNLDRPRFGGMRIAVIVPRDSRIAADGSDNALELLVICNTLSEWCNSEPSAASSGVGKSVDAEAA